jgi:hypothetical protein
MCSKFVNDGLMFDVSCLSKMSRSVVDNIQSTNHVDRCRRYDRVHSSNLFTLVVNCRSMRADSIRHSIGYGSLNCLLNFSNMRTFLEQLASNEHVNLVDLLTCFVRHYHIESSSTTIDCSKHFPMLLAIYRATLSNNDQHTLTCIFQYEQAGHSMRSALIWGDTAMKSSIKHALWQTSPIEQVLNLLDDRMVLKSIQYYPVTRRLRVSCRHDNEPYACSTHIFVRRQSSRLFMNKAITPMILPIYCPCSIIRSAQVKQVNR